MDNWKWSKGVDYKVKPNTAIKKVKNSFNCRLRKLKIRALSRQKMIYRIPIFTFGILVTSTFTLLGCTQNSPDVQVESVIASTKSASKLDKTNTVQLPTSNSEMELSIAKQAYDPTTTLVQPPKPTTTLVQPPKPTTTLVQPPKPSTKSPFKEKNDSQFVYRDPKELLGMGSVYVSDLLGMPSLLRRETPAEVWQYISEDCVLNIYMYENSISSEHFEVTYYEFHQVTEIQNDDKYCFSKIIKNTKTILEMPPHSLPLNEHKS